MRQLCRSRLTGMRSIDEALEEQYAKGLGGSVSDLLRVPSRGFHFGLWIFGALACSLLSR